MEIHEIRAENQKDCLSVLAQFKESLNVDQKESEIKSVR